MTALYVLPRKNGFPVDEQKCYEMGQRLVNMVRDKIG